MEFGKEIRKLRKVKKIKMTELATQLKISSSYLSKIERGKAACKTDIVEQVAKITKTKLLVVFLDE